MVQPRFAPGSPARLAHALGLIALQALSMALAFGWLMPGLLGGFDGLLSADLGAFAAVFALFALQVGLICGLGLFKAGRVGPVALGWRPGKLSQQVAMGLAGAGLMVSALLGTLALMGGGGPTLAVEAMAQWTAQQRLLFLCIGVTAALSEETLFRGYLQPELCKRLGLVPGVLATAGVFSLYHLNFNPMSLVAKAAFGVILGGLRGVDGPLIAPALAHCAFWVLVGFV